MATEPESSPRRPLLSVVTIGHYRHGKSTLTAAITRVLAARTDASATPLAVVDLDRRGGPGAWLSTTPDVTRTVAASSIRYTTDRRSFIHIDCPGHRPWLKNASRAQALADAAILVVSAPESIQPQTHEHLLLAHALGLRQLVVFITKCDEVQDLEWIDLVERDVRDLLDRTGFDGNATRILRGAALPVLQSTDSPWAASVRDLIDALEIDLAVPHPDPAGPPLLFIHRFFNTPQFPRDVIAEARVRRGTLKHQDRLVLLGFGDSVQVRVDGLEVTNVRTDSVEPGERVGIHLHSLDRELDARALFAGQALVPRNHLPATQDFRARVSLLPTAEGGRPTGIRAGHIVLVLFGTTVIAGTLQPAQDTVVAPGETAEMSIHLRAPVYLEPGMPFLLRDGNQGAAWKRGSKPLWAGTSGHGTVLTTRSP